VSLSSSQAGFRSPESMSILRRQFDKTYVTASFEDQGRAVMRNFVLVNGRDNG